MEVTVLSQETNRVSERCDLHLLLSCILQRIRCGERGTTTSLIFPPDRSGSIQSCFYLNSQITCFFRPFDWLESCSLSPSHCRETLHSCQRLPPTFPSVYHKSPSQFSFCFGSPNYSKATISFFSNLLPPIPFSLSPLSLTLTFCNSQSCWDLAGLSWPPLLLAEPTTLHLHQQVLTFPWAPQLVHPTLLPNLNAELLLWKVWFLNIKHSWNNLLRWHAEARKNDINSKKIHVF